MADRRRQITQLLATRYDGLYLPAGALQTRAGLVPAAREPCTSCGGVLLRDDFGRELRRRKGRGWILDRYQRREPCTHCAGDGEIARDPMDAQHARIGSETTAATARPRATVRCDACEGQGAHGNGRRCTVCGGSGRRDLHVFELHIDARDQAERDPLLQAIQARNESGSYHELEQALAGIRGQRDKPPRFAVLTAHATWTLRLLDAVYLPPPARDPDELATSERTLVELGLAYLDHRMPDPIKVPPDVVANARERRDWARRAKGRQTDRRALEQRDRDIRQALRRGTPTQRVAFEYGLSVARVNAIMRGDAA